MEAILKLLTADPEKAIDKIRKTGSEKAEKITNYRKEYVNHDRSLRKEQIDKTQKDKKVGEGERSRTVTAVRIPVNFAKKIVQTSSSFEVGKPITLIPSEENNLSVLIKKIWKINRVDNLIQKAVRLKKSETQGAFQFYIQPIKPSSILNKVLTQVGLKKQNTEIKVKVLDNTKGTMTPYFDDFDDMILFMWEYTTVNSNDKTIKNVRVWDKTNCYSYSDESGKLDLQETKSHGFDRIPIVYTSQDEPEWFDVRELIDRYETTLSKLGGSNDYSAYPILQIFGKIKDFPDKDENGKVLNFPIDVDPESGKPIHGEAKFVNADNAVDSCKLEIETIESLIYSISSTPNLSFDNVKGISSVSGIALKLMFLDAITKASMNEGENRTMIERIVNIIIGGVITSTNTSMRSLSESLFYEIEFNSILPDDLKEAASIMTQLKSSGLVSTQTAVKQLDINPDTEEELELIKKENLNIGIKQKD
ncbi:MAG: hypothetical protein BM557_02115 [Flavobacterium sp. MedPE-SWcel]|uniref:phage portal protein n=1 Tax=uncultured Flavobacterium sp. TaxID=165435 RepID=UPI00092242DD|nr:phage portal protein [uncultured Flavobacterium sp.]OIQ22193.1 MAG: hypothetical protein BM557_02115 [Flavobacterium sp. MedPE-SWcel]